MLQSLATVDHISLPPDGKGTVRALSRIGYELHAAIADIIDNSIDAEATVVEVTFYRNDNTVTLVTIADNGKGMNMAALNKGMQFAGRTDHDSEDLGTYGMGLKSASFSHAKTLTVISRQNDKVVASRWSVEAIDNDWQCAVLDAESASLVFDEMCLRGKSISCGTLIIWERLDRLIVGQQNDALEEFLMTALARLEAHLGLIFHRFLQTTAFSISIVVRHELRTLALPRPVRPRDPFRYANSGVKGWPKTMICEMPGIGSLALQTHIWPPGSAIDDFLLGGRKGIEFQGLFFYRNDRLIQTGGWNSMFRADLDPELILARVAIELPPKGIDINVQKSALQITASQAMALMTATDGEINFVDYLEAARLASRTFRRTRKPPVPTPVVIGSGIPIAVRKAAQKSIAGTRFAEEICFFWQELDEGKVFDLDLMGMNIILNRTYRKEILEGGSASMTDAPLVKILLFQLYKDNFSLSRSTLKQREHIDLTNMLMLEVLRIRSRNINE